LHPSGASGEQVDSALGRIGTSPILVRALPGLIPLWAGNAGRVEVYSHSKGSRGTAGAAFFRPELAIPTREDAMLMLLDFLSYLVLGLLIIPGLFEFLQTSLGGLLPGG